MREIYEIRRLTQADTALILASDAFDHRPRRDQTAGFLSNDNHEIVGAIHEGRLIGFASGVILLHPDKAPQFFISEVGVNEAHRKKGVATRLVTALIAVAKDKGCDGLWLATEKDNEPARGLYKKLKARETKDIVVYDWGGVMDD